MMNCWKIIAKSDNDDNESVNSDTVNEITQQLKDNVMALKEKLHELESWAY